MKQQKAPPPVADINVTPMVDVMLVLLIIFMVITPMLTKGQPIDLVRTTNPVTMQAADKEDSMERRLAARIPMGLFVVDVKTGAVTTIHKSTDWLNHLEFSPTDPTLLMFCHEGPWHKVDRLWTIRTDGSHITKIHTRTMAMALGGRPVDSAKMVWSRGCIAYLCGRS